MPNILVVDDEATIREGLAKSVRDASSGDIAVFPAGNGLEALACVSSRDIDVVFTDMKMPLCSGLELIERLRANSYGGQVVVVSGFGDYDLVRKAMRLGAVDYLLKPIEPREFHTALEECIARIPPKGAIPDSSAKARGALGKQSPAAGAGMTGDPGRLLQEAVFYDCDRMPAFVQESFPYDASIKALVDSACRCDIEAFSRGLSELFGLVCRDKPPVNEARRIFANLVYSMMACNGVFIGIVSRHEFTGEDIFHAIWGESSASGLLARMLGIFNVYFEEALGNGQSRDSYYVQKAKNFVKDHYKEDIGLADVSSVIGLHPNYFCTVFRKETGGTFSHYVREYRIERAMELMRGTNLKLYEIAEQVGYHDNAHFYRVFKETTGLSPEQHRKSMTV